MKKKFSRSKLLKWLKSTVGVTLLSISLSNNVSSLITNVSTPQFFANAMDNRIEAFPKGQYIVEFKYTDHKNDEEDFPYCKTVLAFAYDANLKNGGKILNLSLLLPQIGQFEYIVSNTEHNGAYKLTSIFVKQPENPLELEQLISKLNEHATFVALDDGSGYITRDNSFINGAKFA